MARSVGGVMKWILIVGGALIVILSIVGTGLYFVLRPARTITAGSS